MDLGVLVLWWRNKRKSRKFRWLTNNVWLQRLLKNVVLEWHANKLQLLFLLLKLTWKNTVYLYLVFQYIKKKIFFKNLKKSENYFNNIPSVISNVKFNLYFKYLKLKISSKWEVISNISKKSTWIQIFHLRYYLPMKQIFTSI